MAKYLGFLISGGIISMNGGILLLFGLIYRTIFNGGSIPPELEKVFTGLIVSGAIILIVGLTFLFIGLYRRSHRFDYIA